jgi:predicted dehydrogenase
MENNESKTTETSRRDFVKKGALAIGGFYLVPRHVLGGKGFIAPSDKLNIASIGAGGKGSSDIRNAYNKGANNVVALCDVDFNGSAKATATTFKDAKQYKDWRVMLNEMGKDIDALTISTPDHNHAVIASAAMQLGKHVYVQKPLTHNIAEARYLTEAARKHKVVTQMGNQGASNPAQQQMVKWFDEGIVGPIHTVQIWTNRPVWPQGIPTPTGKPNMPDGINWENWVGPADWVDYHPGYHPFKWRGWWNFGTGALGDIGCHTIDTPFRVLGLNYPTEVECSVGSVFIKDWTPEWIPEGCPPSSQVQIKFPATAKNKSEMKMIWMDGGIRPFYPEWISPDEPLSDDGGANGVLMIGKKGIISCGMYGLNPKIYMKDGTKIETPKVDRNNTPATTLPEYGHQVSWTEACKAGFGSKEHKALTSSFDYSGPLTETVLMGNLAIRSYMLRKAKGTGFDYYGRKKLLWNGNDMKITNFDDANQFVKRQYRDGWKLA